MRPRHRARRRDRHHGTWSTTPTSSPGSSSSEQTGAVLKRGADRRSRARSGPRRAYAEAPLASAPSSSRSSTSRMRSAPSTRCAKLIRPGARSTATIPVMLDGAQARAPLRRSTCVELGCDFYAFSRPQGSTGRPAIGPSSTAAAALLEAMPPYQGGGEMIRVRQLREARPIAPPPAQASRPARPTSRASVGLGASIDFLEPDRPAGGALPTEEDRPRLRHVRGSRSCSRGCPQIEIYGPAKHKAGASSPS